MDEHALVWVRTYFCKLFSVQQELEWIKKISSNSSDDYNPTGFICQPMNYTFNINDDAPAANCFVINSDFYQLNANRNLQNSTTQYTNSPAHMYDETTENNKLIAKVQYA